MSGMFGTSAAQVGQRVSIIWLSLPFLFALVSAYFLPCLMRLRMLPEAILQPQFRSEDVAWTLAIAIFGKVGRRDGN